MLSVHHVVFCVGVVAIALTGAHALTDEEKSAIHALVKPFVEECGKEYGVSEEDIKAAKEAGTLKDLNPCLISCVLKKIEIFDDKGMFDEEKATELTNKFVPNEEEKQKALNIIHTCASINDKGVSDGDKGCDRAKLMVECYLPFKAELPGTP